MSWFRRKRKQHNLRYSAAVLDISRLYGNIAIAREGRGTQIDLRVTDGTPQELASFVVAPVNGWLSMAGGDPNGGRRVVHLTEPGNPNQVMRNTRIKGGGPGSIAIGSVSGDMHFNRSTGDAYIGSARGVEFGPGFTIYLTLGRGVQLVGG